MASNFKILTQQNNGDLHLKLKGDFDGSSAFELINALKAHNGRAGKIVIDTSGLEPAATELANRLARDIGHLTASQIEQLLDLLKTKQS